MSSKNRISSIVNERLVVSFVIFVVMATLLIKTFSIRNPSARMLPLIIAIPTVIFCIIDLVRVIRENMKKQMAEQEPEKGNFEKPSSSALKEFAAFAWFGGYIFFVWLFSFLMMSPIFTFLMSKLYFKTSFKLASISAIICFGIVYFIFFKLLSIYSVGRGIFITIL